MTRRSICEALEAGRIEEVHFVDGISYTGVHAVEPMPDAVYITVSPQNVPPSETHGYIRADEEEMVLRADYKNVKYVIVRFAVCTFSDCRGYAEAVRS